MPAPVIGYLQYRIVDNDTGAELVADLPHPHMSQWQVRALQPGAIGSATLGSATIPLYAPYSREGQAADAKAAYDLLAQGQRVEAYWAGTGSTTPYQSGIITAIDRPMDGPWTIHVADTLWILQQSQMFPAEQVGPSNGPALLVKLFSGTREVVYDAYATALTVASGSVTTTTDPQLGLPAVATTGLAILVSPTSWNANGQYNWATLPSDAFASSITLWGVIAADTNTSNSGGCGLLWLSDATGANGYMAEMVTNYSGAASTGWSVVVKVWSIAAGVFTLRTSAPTVFTGLLSNVFPFQFSITLSESGSDHLANLFLNGKDTGVYFIPALPVIASGRIGIRTTGPGTTATVYMNRIRFESRTGQYGVNATWGTNRFQVGTTTATSAVIPQIRSQGQTHLDIMQLAMALDGFALLKTPGRGYKSDTLTYGVLGSNLSTSIRFTEGENVVAQGTGVHPVADLYSTTTRYSAVPGGNSGGTVEWSPIGTAGSMVLIDSVTDVGAPDAALQIATALRTSARKSNPMQAYAVNVLRTPDIAEKFGLYDLVQVDIPTLRVNRTTLQVIGWDFTEGQAEMVVYLNQFPRESLPEQGIQRIVRPIEWLAEHAT
jgi:hypothetical protein